MVMVMKSAYETSVNHGIPVSSQPLCSHKLALLTASRWKRESGDTGRYIAQNIKFERTTYVSPWRSRVMNLLCVILPACHAAQVTARALDSFELLREEPRPGIILLSVADHTVEYPSRPADRGLLHASIPWESNTDTLVFSRASVSARPPHNTQSGLEVDGLLRAQSPVKDKKPALERHISHIPQDDEEDNAAADDHLKPEGGFANRIKNKLKKTVSRESRGDHCDEKTRPTSPRKGHTRSSSGLEVSGVMRFDPDHEEPEDEHSNKPSLIRKLTNARFLPFRMTIMTAMAKDRFKGAEAEVENQVLHFLSHLKASSVDISLSLSWAIISCIDLTPFMDATDRMAAKLDILIDFVRLLIGVQAPLYQTLTEITDE
ncbi:uncharacterized protein MYCFIDRAFT_171275 [Pseudocercospora fijiensis CIRAD86]|uniref:Uncharacterized protein n=1 Tax=Pseudocercospora fijiensis (strain CIRAD86) TaxID=383855 RepID=M3A2D5_PSEFD|nr:uncharacterized protein MYCFIDRAFT_171275 [Pseudocercospora fijiensis CIRAD86]EME85339.1 hypothetical protein MYCFIDRAFT_171275 [Pseudocercospora fijiensis CIRAD86]